MPIKVNGVTAHLGVFDMPTSVAFYSYQISTS